MSDAPISEDVRSSYLLLRPVARAVLQRIRRTVKCRVRRSWTMPLRVMPSKVSAKFKPVGPRQPLTLDSNRTDIASLSMGFNQDSTCANRQIIRQPENHFSEREVSQGLNLLRRHLVTMITCICEINDDRGSRLALR